MTQPISLNDVRANGGRFELPDDCRTLLIGEGADDANVLAALSRDLGMKGALGFNLQGRGRGAQSAVLRDKMRLLDNMRGFRDLDAFAVTLDAEDGKSKSNAQKTLKMINNVLAAPPFNLPEPVPHGGVAQLPGRETRVGVFVFPGGGAQEGMLEDLFWRAVENTPEANCVKEFRECLDTIKNRRAMEEQSKRRMQTFLSAMPRHCVNLGVMVNKLEKPLIEKILNAPAFGEVREFLRNLAP